MLARMKENENYALNLFVCSFLAYSLDSTYVGLR